LKRILEPLALIPGVRMALVVAHDGVPVVVKNVSDGASDRTLDATLASETAESLSALAAGWLAELERSIAPLTWDSPQRVVLRAARGSLVITHAPGALLLVIADQRMSPEELRLPMEAAVARMQRLLRSAQDREQQVRAAVEPALPAPDESKGTAPSRADTAS
jgi:predicted regulator of Ras-like GTPase activity (Roadblock/LC7/MglB family)